MLKKTRFLLLVIFFLTAINGVLAFKYYSTLKTLREGKYDPKNQSEILTFRISESSRIHSKLKDQILTDFNDVIDTTGNNFPFTISKSFERSYILVFTHNQCFSCIESALRIVSDLSKNKKFQIKVLASYSNPLGYFLLTKKFGINSSNCFYTQSLTNLLIEDEEIPVLVYCENEGRIEKACFVDKYLPIEFYKNFLSSK